jgi:uncharacterized damage-inducible protein DinB
MNAHDVLMYGHRWVHRHLNDLTDEQWLAGGVCGFWSVKDIVSHLASYEWVLVDVLAGFVEPGPTLILDQFIRQRGDDFNAAQINQRKEWSPAQVLADYDAGYERVMDLLTRIAEQRQRQPGTLPWYGNEYSLEDLLVYQYYGHKREHMAQVSVYRDTLKH